MFRLGGLLAALPYVAVLIGLIWFQNGWLAMGLYHLGMALTVVSGPGLARLRRGWHGPTGALLLLFCVLAGPALWLALPHAALAGSSLAGRLAHFGIGAESWPWFAVYYTVMNGWLEELLWRDRLAGTARGPSRYDALFAGYHVLVLGKFMSPPWVALTVVVLLGTAWLWRTAARRHGGLAIPVVTHVVANASVMLGVHFRLG